MPSSTKSLLSQSLLPLLSPHKQNHQPSPPSTQYHHRNKWKSNFMNLRRSESDWLSGSSVWMQWLIRQSMALLYGDDDCHSYGKVLWWSAQGVFQQLIISRTATPRREVTKYLLGKKEFCVSWEIESIVAVCAHPHNNHNHQCHPSSPKHSRVHHEYVHIAITITITIQCISYTSPPSDKVHFQRELDAPDDATPEFLDYLLAILAGMKQCVVWDLCEGWLWLQWLGGML